MLRIGFIYIIAAITVAPWPDSCFFLALEVIREAKPQFVILARKQGSCKVLCPETRKNTDHYKALLSKTRPINISLKENRENKENFKKENLKSLRKYTKPDQISNYTSLLNMSWGYVELSLLASPCMSYRNTIEMIQSNELSHIKVRKWKTSMHNTDVPCNCTV